MALFDPIKHVFVDERRSDCRSMCRASFSDKEMQKACRKACGGANPPLTSQDYLDSLPIQVRELYEAQLGYEISSYEGLGALADNSANDSSSYITFAVIGLIALALYLYMK